MKNSGRTTRTKPSKVPIATRPKHSAKKSVKLEQENRRLKSLVKSLRKDISSDVKQEDLAVLKIASRRPGNVENSFTPVERRDDSLINLFVATSRLHADLDRAGVLTAIREILSDVIGCRAMAVFEIDPTGSVLSMVDCVNSQADDFSCIPVGVGPIGKVAQTGESYFASSDDQRLLACVPLKFADRITGAIAVFQLLDQKLEFQASDRELFDLLSTHAGLALHRATLQAKWRSAIGVQG